MKSLGTRLALVVIVAFFHPAFIQPCTTFCFKVDGEWIFGRNYDFEIEYGLIIVNKRGVTKTALLQPGTGDPARWVSRYGSVTFNQFGREFPLGGMNEAGLVIELMWLNQTEYPKADSRPALQDLQWIQYQLDTAATAEEVIASDKEVRIEAKTSQPLHFLVCDRRGNAAAIEFLGGRLRAYTGKSLPVAALTNSPYEDSLDLLSLCGGKENHPSFKQAGDSLQRFVLAANGLRTWDHKTSSDPVAYAFQVLDRADAPNSKFRIVYDVKSGLISFRTKSTPEIRTVNVRKFEFACSTPVKILDVLAELKGDMTGQFRDYTEQANYDLIKKSFGGTEFLKGTPEENLQYFSKYPESLLCK